MLTNLQKITAQAIINVFETGRPAGNYGAVTFRKDDVGCLTFGRAQATLAGGSLALLLKEYCDAPEAALAAELRAYQPRLDARDRSLDTDARFASLLRSAGADPVMRPVEDHFFDLEYWHPAVRAAESLVIPSALGTAVVYDSFIHGAWARLRDATLSRIGPPSTPEAATSAGGEHAWVREYITLRRDWLANHPNPLLRRSVYRMDTFLALAGAANWDLALPLEAHGVTISEATLAGGNNPPPPQASRYNHFASKLKIES
jgi:chitosanase